MENAIDHKRFVRFKEFMALVARNHHKTEELDKMRSILRELGKGGQREGWKIAQKWERQIRDGVSLGTLWSSQIMTVKGIFWWSIKVEFPLRAKRTDLSIAVITR